MILMINEIIVPLNGVYGVVDQIVEKNKSYIKKPENKRSNKINYDALKKLIGEEEFKKLYEDEP
jgi:hypothetical protein